MEILDWVLLYIGSYIFSMVFFCLVNRINPGGDGYYQIPLSKAWKASFFSILVPALILIHMIIEGIYNLSTWILSKFEFGLPDSFHNWYNGEDK